MNVPFRPAFSWHVHAAIYLITHIFTHNLTSFLESIRAISKETTPPKVFQLTLPLTTPAWPWPTPTARSSRGPRTPSS